MDSVGLYPRMVPRTGPKFFGADCYTLWYN
jgi:hypothetical protein